MMTTEEYHGYSIFCDDIRSEVGGKLSIMGTYAEALIVEEFPVTLAKLCVASWLHFPADATFESLSVRLMQGKEAISTSEFPAMPKKIAEKREEIIAVRRRYEPPDYEDDSPRRTVLHTHFVVSPLQLDEACSLRVRADIDGETVKLGRLVILDRLTFEAREKETEELINS